MSKNTTRDIIAQEYQLMPNPNNGNFAIQQKLIDIQPVWAEIWNEIGQRIYKQQIIFSNLAVELKLKSIEQGLYLLKLTDSKGKLYTIKFVVR